MQRSIIAKKNLNHSDASENPNSSNSALTELNPDIITSNRERLEDGSRETNEDAVCQSVIDITGKKLEFDLLERAKDVESDDVEGLYLYKNEFSLVPRSVSELGKVRIFKFFGNEVNLLPKEFGNLVGLECLQVKMPHPLLKELGFSKLKRLKELELSKASPRSLGLTILSEISGLKSLTKLSVCHFSIRYLPPEIGFLTNLEYLDLSFNKIKSLPTEISYLSALISFKVANNKLAELPSSLSLLQKLEHLDLSNNRLTSLGGLDLSLMQSLQYVNLQYNKLISCCHIPARICCHLEGNGKDFSNDDFISSTVEMDVYEASPQDLSRNFCCDGSHHAGSSLLTGSSSNSRCFAARRSSKRWKRHYYQQKARHERLNSSRKWKGEGCAELFSLKESQSSKLDNVNVLSGKTEIEETSDITDLDDGDEEVLSGEAKDENLLIEETSDITDLDDGEEEVLSGEAKDENLLSCVDESSKKGSYVESFLSEPKSIHKGRDGKSCFPDNYLSTAHDEIDRQDGYSSSEASKNTYNSKRHCDRDLDNPKPCKYRRPTEDSLNLSYKYSDSSFCSIEDRLPDGFYDAGRDRPFMTLTCYEEILPHHSREVILLDRQKDEKLDALVLSAQAYVYQYSFAKEKKIAMNNLQAASLLALFVSDHFGGSDKSTTIERLRKTVSGSNYRKPFVCTCSTGNNDNNSTPTRPVAETVEDIIFTDLCERSLRSIKGRRNSVIVPLGSLQFGICRHRALLMKYLCDRMEPPIPCELVRGYLDFLPHAWNVVLIKRGGVLVRMVVDACCPHDIREETDAEYFCRYIPLSRTTVSLSTESFPVPGCSFPSLSTFHLIDKTASSSIIRCEFGLVEAAAKVRTLKICETSVDQISSFEYSCLGEVRIFGALKHPCIVEMYGHELSSKWISSDDGTLKGRILRSVILMEYVKGGSLKSYVKKMSKAGEKHVQVELALAIARDVASALVEMHSKHIVHRDIKSENILIDLDQKLADGSPVVKLSDFDTAVPLRSSLHTCCIGHKGIPPPEVCIGTPRWMAPEVVRVMHKRSTYGLEVDIWSYGCVILEMLTLQVPYSGLSELQIHEHLQMGKRPSLSYELEALGSMNELGVTRSCSDVQQGPEAESETLKFLVDLFRQCTQENPADRPTAVDVYEMLCAHTNSH